MLHTISRFAVNAIPHLIEGKKMNHKTLALTLLGSGLALNGLDAYFSGNLPFSPAQSSTLNTVTTINNYLPVPTGTLMAIAGIALFIWG